MIEHDWGRSSWRHCLFRACGRAVVSYPVIGVLGVSGVSVAGSRHLTVFPAKDELVAGTAIGNDGKMCASNVYSSGSSDGIRVVRTARARVVVLIYQRSAQSENVRNTYGVCVIIIHVRLISRAVVEDLEEVVP